MVSPFLSAGFRALAAVPVAALILGACSSAEVSRFHRFSEDPYLQRGESARILPGPPRDLSDEGYIPLGRVEVRQPVRECHGTTCWDFRHDRLARDTASEIAGQRGGDVILLDKDREVAREVSQKQGKCKHPNVPMGALRSRPVIPGDCFEYEIVPVIKETEITDGYVWRHEPGSVNEASRALWRRWFVEGPRETIQEVEKPVENIEE